MRPPLDAVTVNPSLGGDALAPFLEAAVAGGRGVFALVRTSNPGAAELQDLPLASGGLWHEEVARRVAGWGADSVRPLGPVGARRRRRRDRPRAAGGAPRPDAAPALPHPRRRRPGRPARGPRPGLRRPPGRGAGLGEPVDHLRRVPAPGRRGRCARSCGAPSRAPPPRPDHRWGAGRQSQATGRRPATAHDCRSRSRSGRPSALDQRCRGTAPTDPDRRRSVAGLDSSPGSGRPRSPGRGPSGAGPTRARSAWRSPRAREHHGRASPTGRLAQPRLADAPGAARHDPPAATERRRVTHRPARPRVIVADAWPRHVGGPLPRNRALEVPLRQRPVVLHAAARRSGRSSPSTVGAAALADTARSCTTWHGASGLAGQGK